MPEAQNKVTQTKSNSAPSAENNDLYDKTDFDRDSVEELSDKYSLLYDEKDLQYYQNINSKMMISVYLVNKSLGTDRIDKNNCIHLPLKGVIKKIIINQNIYSFGTMCSLICLSINNNLSYFLEKPELYHIVINIVIPNEGKANKDNGVVSYYKLEPYIFCIDKIKEIGRENNQTIYSIYLDDIYTSAAKHHSWASLLKWYSSTLNSYSYTSLIFNIFEYLKDVLRLETHSAFKFEKEFYCEDDKFNWKNIVTTTLKKIPPTATIYEALSIIWDDIELTFDYPFNFSEKYETFNKENVFPMSRGFFQEEYVDPLGLYPKILINSTNSYENPETGKLELNDKGKKNQSGYVPNQTFSADDTSNILHRYFTLRSLYLPYYFAFGNGRNGDARGVVWETINKPNIEMIEDPTFYVLSTITNSPIYNYVQYPLDPSLIYKSWKNYIFQTESCVGESKRTFDIFQLG